MKKNLFFVALAALAFASCSDDTFVGENSPNLGSANGDGSIQFSSNLPNATRAGEFVGATAAQKLGNNFYVTGTKGTEAATYPTATLVFDNYLVHYGANTAGVTKSNTHNWEYVGIDQGASPKLPEDYNRVKLSSITGAQTIKYWDYSTAQYDFLAFSTGTYKAVATNSGAADEIGVTAMRYGESLKNKHVTNTVRQKSQVVLYFVRKK